MEICLSLSSVHGVGALSVCQCLRGSNGVQNQALGRPGNAARGGAIVYGGNKAPGSSGTTGPDSAEAGAQAGATTGATTGTTTGATTGVSLLGCTFTGNQAGQYASAAYIELNSSWVEVINTSFTANECRLEPWCGVLNMKDGTMDAGTAGTAIIHGCSFTHNTHPLSGYALQVSCDAVEDKWF